MITVPSPSASTGSKTLDNHLNQIPPGHLHHFCSSQALVGIAKNKELWATDLGFMNDEAERDHGIGLFAHRLMERRKNETKDGFDEIFFSKLREQIVSRGLAPRIFSASLTFNVTLSMFRLYCPDGGYCVRFPTTQLRDMCADQNFQLVKCVYKDEYKLRIIDELLDYIIGDYRTHRAGLENGTIPPHPGSKYDNGAVMNFAIQVAQWAPIMKDVSFEIEDEWRLISQPIDSPSDEIDFRDGRFNVTPYYKFKLSRMSDGDDLNKVLGRDDSLSVWLGPANSNQERRAVAAKWLFRRYFSNGASVGVRLFETSFR